MDQETDSQINGDVPTKGHEPGVGPATKAPPTELLPLSGQDPGEKVNEQLLDEIKQKILAINPDIFKGVVQELANLIEDFKSNMPTFEMLQYTMPDAYNNLLSIFGTLSTLAQLMLQNGDLPSDQSVVSEAAEQEIMSNVQEQGIDTSTPGGEESYHKKRQISPIGEIRNNGADGRPRIKTQNGWKYVSAGLGASVGRQK